MGHSVRAMALLCGALVISTVATGQSREQVNQEARAIFKELIEINTTDSTGNVTLAAEAMAKRLREAGYPQEDVIVAGPEERKKNLVVRLRGTGQKKPVLFIGHLYVVEALPSDWSVDPFVFQAGDGIRDGRGTEDMKE